MSVHHPYDDTLARYAAGRLSAGPALVVATHLHGCRECRARVRLFAAVGGALLEEAPVAAVRPDMFAATLRRIEEPDVRPEAFAKPASPLDGIPMPAWRGVGRGFQWRRLTLPYAPDANVIMLKVQPGQRMPQHTHAGVEYTQILQGGFTDDFGHYMAGDCIEADEEVEHQPRVDSGVECVCLAAFDGKLKLQGWVGRLIQPWLGL